MTRKADQHTLTFLLFWTAFVMGAASGQQAAPAQPQESAPMSAQQLSNAPPGAATKPPPGSSGSPGAAGAPSGPQTGLVPSGDAQAQGSGTGELVTLDLSGALSRARAYNQQFFAAGTAAGLAREDRVQAKAALLPTLNAFNQFIYTQGNGTPSGVFVANDGVHVYNEQATVHAEVFSIAKRADYHRAQAAEAAATARLEVARRGLVATVVQSYYGLITAQRHLTNAARSADEAQQFVDISRKQEAGGEVARADVIKAELQLQQRQRELLDAETNAARARLALGVLMFPDIEQRFSIQDDLRPDAPLPPLEEVRTLALNNNPEARAAEAGLRQAQFAVTSARAAYYPALVLDYFWGIDANVFGIHGPGDRQNLGSVVQATVNVPVWNWGTTQSKVRQAEIQRRQAQFDLTFAQRQIQSDIQSYYLEARAARSQLASLRSSLDLASESLRLTLLRYQAGEATALEVVDAQSTLAQARNGYDDGLARYRLALANLQVLTGRF